MTNDSNQTHQPKLLAQLVACVLSITVCVRIKLIVDWIKRYIGYHSKRQPLEIGAAEVEDFLRILRCREMYQPESRIKLKARCCFYTKKCWGLFDWLDDLK